MHKYGGRTQNGIEGLQIIELYFYAVNPLYAAEYYEAIYGPQCLTKID